MEDRGADLSKVKVTKAEVVLWGSVHRLTIFIGTILTTFPHSHPRLEKYGAFTKQNKALKASVASSLGLSKKSKKSKSKLKAEDEGLASRAGKKDTEGPAGRDEMTNWRKDLLYGRKDRTKEKTSASSCRQACHASSRYLTFDNLETEPNPETEGVAKAPANSIAKGIQSSAPPSTNANSLVTERSINAVSTTASRTHSTLPALADLNLGDAI